MLDEFESDQKGYGLRQVLRLARSASSADTQVLKGTPEGKAMTFSLRTTFFFAAINPRGMSVADQSRIMMLELLMHDSESAKAHAIAREEAYFRSLGSNWCSYMVSLADRVVPAIDLIEPLIVSADRRHRQNISTLLGAAFVALHARGPSLEEARQLARDFEPVVVRHAEENERDDAQECLDHLFAHIIQDYPLGHWLASERDRLVMKDNSPFLWTTIVAMYDIVLKVDGEQPGLLIRHGSPAIERAFANTRWAGGAWQKALRKLPGYFAPKNPVQFPASGTKARATGVSLSYIPEKLPMNASDRY